MLILVLAANTAYADFPRLASILARDRYLPRQFMNQGDRLAFSNGIVGLSVFAAILLVVFGGDTHALIPLYMIGVFVSFTLSQAGMVVRWRRLRTPGWRSQRVVNGVGALVTGIVLLVVAATKAHEGAWIIILLIPINVLFFRVTRRHYDGVGGAAVAARAGSRRAVRSNTVLVPISGIQRAVVEALDYAKTLSRDVRAVYVNIDPAETERLQVAVGAVGRRRAAGGARIAVPVADGAAARVHRAGRTREHPDDYVTSCCRSSCRRAGGTTCSTISARCSSRARCSSSRTRSSRACRSTCTGRSVPGSWAFVPGPCTGSMVHIVGVWTSPQEPRTRNP